ISSHGQHLLALALLLGCTIYTASCLGQEQEASYRNQTVSQWVEALHHADAGVRSEAAYALGQIGPPARVAFADLLAVFQKDSETFVRQEAGYALGSLGAAAKQAVPVLLTALQTELATGVRASAA